MSSDNLPGTYILQPLPIGVHDLTNHISNTSRLAVGYGGFSDVFIGELNQPAVNVITGLVFLVGIKVIRAFTESGQRDLQKATKRLNREVNIFQRLDHRNIARFLGISYHMANHPAIVMEWYELGDAKRYVKDRPELLFEDRSTLVSGVLQGLLYLHTLDPPVIHGDLKANNVLINNKHEAVLTDFGLSKVVEKLSRSAGSSTSTGAGALRWKAPELLRGGKVTLASDIWAFGCTSFELLMAEIPYSSHKFGYLIETSILGGILPFDEGSLGIKVPQWMWDIAKKCWALEPADRPCVDELACSLETYS